MISKFNGNRTGENNVVRETKDKTDHAIGRFTMELLASSPPTPLLHIYLRTCLCLSKFTLISQSPMHFEILRVRLFSFTPTPSPAIASCCTLLLFIVSFFFFVVENPDFKQVVLPVIWLLTPLLARPIYALVLFQIPEVDRRIAFVKCDAQYFSRHVYLPLSFFF